MKYRPMFGPIWIDPNYYRQWGWTETTNVTRPYAQPADEGGIRKIVREEIADLPIKYDVPDVPPDEEARA